MPSTILPEFKVQAHVGPLSIETVGDKNAAVSQPSDGKRKKTRRVVSISETREFQRTGESLTVSTYTIS